MGNTFQRLNLRMWLWPVVALLCGCHGGDFTELQAGVSVSEVEQHAAVLKRALDRELARKTKPSASTPGAKVNWIEPVQSLPANWAVAPRQKRNHEVASVMPNASPPVLAPPPEGRTDIPGGALPDLEPTAPFSPPKIATKPVQPSAKSRHPGVKPEHKESLDERTAQVWNRAHALDAEFLRGLSPKRRQLIEQLIASESQVDITELANALEGFLARGAIRIRRLELCKHVAGFGVFETLDDTSLLVGRDHRMIVYVELEHYKAVKNSSDLYEVRLEQDVVLYTDDSHGLAVWRQPQVKIVDESRNKRRDFFVVQMIQLPRKLSVGKYRLKVTVVDVHGKTRAEMSQPLQIVAGDPKNL